MHQFLSLLLAVPLAAVAAAVIDDERAFSDHNVIKKDIVILGGGSSGCYSAVRLREDYGKDILVVEKSGRLGGHTETYTDPMTGVPYNYGVQSFVDYPLARAYFERFGVEVDTARSSPGRTTVLVDFSTGKVVSGFVPPASDARATALRKYVDLTRELADPFRAGYWNFYAPQDIPEDLLLPFGEFVEKYGIQAAVPTIYSVTGLGLGDILATTTLYVMQSFVAPLAAAFIGEGSTFTPVSRNNSEIYGRITEVLGSEDVMLDSQVVAARRSHKGVKLVVENSKTGKRTLVKAKRLLVAFVPTIENTGPLGLDGAEEAVFSRQQSVRNYVSVVKHPSLVPNNSYTNTRPDAVPDNYLVYPVAPTATRFDHMGDGHYRVLQVGGDDFMADDARENANVILKRMIDEGTAPQPPEESQQELEFLAFGDHGPMGMTVTGEQLREGHVQEMYALMGPKGTWYTGAAWGAQLSTDIWEACEGVISRMLDDLESLSEEE